MSLLKIGVQLSSFRQPFRKSLELAARTGASGVEIDLRRDVDIRQMSDSAVRQIRKWIDDFNLRVAAVRFRTRRGYHHPDDLEQRLQATRDMMVLAYRLGTPTLINQIGTVPVTPDDSSWQLLVESLSELGRFGQRAGTMLTAETGSEDGATLLKLIEAIPEGCLPVAFNPGNLLVQGFSPHDALQVLAPYITYVSARDATRDLARGRGIEVPLGRGSVDFAEILGTLHEHQYRGYVTVDRDGLDGPPAEVAAGVQYLRALMLA